MQHQKMPLTLNKVQSTFLFGEWPWPHQSGITRLLSPINSLSCLETDRGGGKRGRRRRRTRRRWLSFTVQTVWNDQPGRMLIVLSGGERVIGPQATANVTQSINSRAPHVRTIPALDREGRQQMVKNQRKAIYLRAAPVQADLPSIRCAPQVSEPLLIPRSSLLNEDFWTTGCCSRGHAWCF